MSTVLVTGANGFVGSYVVPALIDRGHRVVALVRSRRAGDLVLERLGEARPFAEIRLGDVTEPRSLPPALAGADAVVHLVAIPRDRDGGTSLRLVNTEGTRNLLAAMREGGVRRLVHLGALGVEDDARLHYASSKAKAEALVAASGLDWTIVKPSLLWGERDGFFNVIAGLVRMSPGLIPVPGTGGSRFQPLAVTDLARILALCLERPETVAQTYAVGGPRIWTYRAIAREVTRAMGAHRAIVPMPVPVISLVAGASEIVGLPFPVATDQLRQLSLDNVTALDSVERSFGFRPADMAGQLGYLRRKPRDQVGVPVPRPEAERPTPSVPPAPAPPSTTGPEERAPPAADASSEPAPADATSGPPPAAALPAAPPPAAPPPVGAASPSATAPVGPTRSPRPSRFRRLVRGLVLALAWLLVAILISLGGAGIVAGVGGGPGSDSRPELTWRGDEAMRPGLDAATADLRRLSSDVDGLGATARGAITALIATDRSHLASSVDQGTAQLQAIQSLTASLRARLLALPGADPAAPGGLASSAELALGPATRTRFSSLLAALDATAGLPVDWASFTSGSLAAESLTTLLLDHDTSTAKAASLGRSGDYAGALKTLDASDAIVARSRSLRDRLAPTTDVTTLTAWLDRNAAYDKALRTLYAALRDSKGIVTPAVRSGFAGEQAARQALPADTRGLVVILGDVARGGLNEAAIEIELARGRLDAALAALQPSAGTPGE